MTTFQAFETKNNGAITGPVWILRPILDRHGIPCHFHGAGVGTHVIGRKWFDDALVALEVAGHTIDYRMSGW